MGTLPEWLQLAAIVLIPMLAGLGFIIKMLFTLGGKIDMHGSRLDSIGTELIRAESELRADHQEMKRDVNKRFDDHELRLRVLERGDR